jgi:hypothetical protein
MTQPRLADFIRGNIEPILQSWEDFARTIEPANLHARIFSAAWWLRIGKFSGNHGNPAANEPAGHAVLQHQQRFVAEYARRLCVRLVLDESSASSENRVPARRSAASTSYSVIARIRHSLILMRSRPLIFATFLAVLRHAP